MGTWTPSGPQHKSIINAGLPVKCCLPWEALASVKGVLGKRRVHNYVEPWHVDAPYSDVHGNIIR